jgi:hypothetical protein
MATIYMTPDSNFNAFIEPINLQKVDLSQRWTAGLKLFEQNGRLFLGDMETSTPATQIPCWHTCIRGATLLQVGEIPVTSIVDVHHALTRTPANNIPVLSFLHFQKSVRTHLTTASPS